MNKIVTKVVKLASSANHHHWHFQWASLWLENWNLLLGAWWNAVKTAIPWCVLKHTILSSSHCELFILVNCIAVWIAIWLRKELFDMLLYLAISYPSQFTLLVLIEHETLPQKDYTDIIFNCQCIGSIWSLKCFNSLHLSLACDKPFFQPSPWVKSGAVFLGMLKGDCLNWFLGVHWIKVAWSTWVAGLKKYISLRVLNLHKIRFAPNVFAKEMVKNFYCMLGFNVLIISFFMFLQER